MEQPANPLTWARFRRRSTHLPNLTDDLSTAKERRLNQFGTAVLVRCGKRLTESVELLSNLTLARHTVRRLNQMSRQVRYKVELIQLSRHMKSTASEPGLSV